MVGCEASTLYCLQGLPLWVIVVAADIYDVDLRLVLMYLRKHVFVGSTDHDCPVFHAE